MASTRRLAAIFAGDVAGFSRPLGTDGEGTLQRLKAHHRHLIAPRLPSIAVVSSRRLVMGCWRPGFGP
jgi:hypothetical protein